MSATPTTHRLRTHMTTDCSEEQRVYRRAVPRFLNVEEAAELLRTTRRAIYAMVERRNCLVSCRFVAASCSALTFC